jgi:hypothetical protein
MRAKRDNPVGVRSLLAGKPTVREAQFPSGKGMTKKRMLVAERQQEIHSNAPAEAQVVEQPGPSVGSSLTSPKHG